MRFKYLAPCVGALLAAHPASAQYYPRAETAPGRVELAPQPPSGAAPNLILPPRSPDGAWLTPNHAVSPEERIWHLRAALNVAALGCRDGRAEQTIDAYNAMLGEQSAALAIADKAVQARYRTRFGPGWQDQYDRQMTRVYNFFAAPPIHDAFCGTAQDVLAEAQSVSPQYFAVFADRALARLEAPFTDFFAAYDGYRVALARWQGVQPLTAPVAMAASAPVSPSGAMILP